MTNERAIRAVFLGDASSLIRASKQAEQSLERVGGRLEQLNDKFGRQLKIATAVGAAAVTGLAAKSIQAASALEEAQNKANEVFGDSVSLVRDFAKTSADSFGISERAANSYAGTLGVILNTSGLAQEESAAMSVSLLALAADLASFNDIAIDEALEKLRSGLVGEAEPLRTVGVLLSAARVEAKAYALGIAQVGDVLTEGQKVQARYAVIMEDTASAQGDFTRTADSAANASRRLTARAEEQAATIGGVLLPMWKGIQQALLQIPAPVIQVGVALLTIATAVGGLLIALPMLAAGMTLVAGSSFTLAGALGVLGAVTLPALILALPLAALGWHKYNVAAKEAEHQSQLTAAATSVVTSMTYANIEANKIAFDAEVALLEAEQANIRAKMDSLGPGANVVVLAREYADRLREVGDKLGAAKDGQHIYTAALNQSEAAQRATAGAANDVAAALGNAEAKAGDAAAALRALNPRILATTYASQLLAAGIQYGSSEFKNFSIGIEQSLRHAAATMGNIEAMAASLLGSAGIDTGSRSSGGGTSSTGGALGAVDVIFKNSQAHRFAAGEYLGRDVGTPGLTLRGQRDQEGKLQNVTIVVQGSIHSDRDLRDFIVEALDDYNRRTGN